MAVARKACDRCHNIVPRNTMRSYEYTERTGHSNGGFMSFNLTGKARPRAGGSRRHYHRIKNMYLCGPCADTRRKDKIFNFFGHLIFWPVLIIALLTLAVHTDTSNPNDFVVDWSGFGMAMLNGTIDVGWYTVKSVAHGIELGAVSLFDYVWSLV